MRKRYIFMFAVGAVLLLALFWFRLPLGVSGLFGPVLLILLAAKGVWSDHERAERMGSIYSHQRLGKGNYSGKYHER